MCLLSVLLVACLFLKPAFWTAETLNAFSDIPTRKANRLAWRNKPIFQSPVLRLGIQLLSRDRYRVLERGEMPDCFKTHANAGKPLEAPEITPFKNIIVLFVESLNEQFLRAGYGEFPTSITPFLDTLPASPASIYTLALPTLRGLSVQLCSHPNAKGIIDQRYPNSVAKTFARDGWNTVFFSSVQRTFQDFYKIIPQLGFAEYYDAIWQMEHGRSHFYHTWGVSDTSTFEVMVDYLDTHRGQKNFVAMLSIDTHEPRGRDVYPGTDYPEPPAFLKGLPAERYLGAHFRNDVSIQRFFEALEKRQLLDEDTIVIITADHCCPPFQDLRDSLKKGISMYDRIPCLVYTKRRNMPQLAKRLASQCDTAPTLTHLAGLEANPAWWGTSLYTRQRKAPLFHVNEGFDEKSGQTQVQENDRLERDFYTFVRE